MLISVNFNCLWHDFLKQKVYFDYTTSFCETDKIKLAHRNLNDAP